MDGVANRTGSARINQKAEADRSKLLLNATQHSVNTKPSAEVKPRRMTVTPEEHIALLLKWPSGADRIRSEKT